LVDAVRTAGNVILAADATREEADTGERSADDTAALDALVPVYRLTGVLEERPILTPPFGDLSRAARGLGHSFFPWDLDGPLRRSVPFVRVHGRPVPSLAVAASAVAGGFSPEQIRLNGNDLHLGEARRPMPLVAGRTGTLGDAAARPTRRALVRFTGPVTRPDGRPTYDEYSFYRLFYAEQQMLAGDRPLVDPAVFRGKVVMVGVTAAGLHDVFAVPFAQGKMPGVEVHANVVDNILSARFMLPAPRVAGLLSIVGVALVVGVLGAFTTAWWVIGGAVLILVAVSAVGVVLFANGVWLPVVAPVFATAIAASGGVAYQYFVEGREKRRIKRVFSRMVAPDVYAHLLADPASTRLGGERREMSVLFSDIRGFTTVSESRRPEEIVSQLNEYFTRMVEVVFRHHGTVDKFVGDMVMALFGAPVTDPDHADRAVRAALDMLDALRDLNATWAREGRPCLQIGIGVNSGEMVAGNIGSEQMMSYTVIGDAVNLGSRLESLNKQYGTSLIISDDTRQRLKGQYHIDALGEVTVKGKTRPVSIFEVRNDRGQAAAGRGDGT
jgi:adenylate cyclase